MQSPSTSPGKRLVAVKNVTVNEDFFQGHFPGTPLMPGVLMIETLAQVATLLLVHGPRRQAVRPCLSARRGRREVPAAGGAGRPAAPGGDAGREAQQAGARACRCAHRRRVVAEAELVMALVPDRRRPGAARWRHHRSERDRASGRRDRRRHRRRTSRHHRRARAASAATAASAPRRRRRLDRDRRRQPDFPVRLDRPDPAGPEVPRREDDAVDRPSQRVPRVRRRSTAARPAAAA